MIRHLVVLRFSEGTTSAQIDAVDAALATLPAQCDTIRVYTHGRDLRLGAGSWDYAVVADFDDAEGWQAYDEHPAHAKVRSEVFAPIVTERAAMRFKL
jgi:hypothetical protein